MISIKKYNHKLQYVWDDFIINSNNGSIFNQQKFLQYHVDKKFVDSSLMFYRGQELVCLLPASLLIIKKKLCLISHPGASWGGFIYNHMCFDVSCQILEVLEKYCIRNKIKVIQLVLAPQYYTTFLGRTLEYSLYIKSYVLLQRYLSHVIVLSRNQNPILYFNKRKQQYLKSKFVNNANYVFRKTENIKSFYSILLENQSQFKTSPTHSYVELEKLRALFPKNIFLFGTYFKKKLIGGVCLFYISKSSALVFYNSLSCAFRGRQIGAYQIYKTIDFCSKKQISYLDLGVSHLPNSKNPLNPKTSLIKFKEQCGGVGVMRNKYNKEL